MAESVYRVPASAEYRLPPSAAVTAVLLTVWLIACDAWVKVLARWSRCTSLDDVRAAFETLGSRTTGCEPLPLGPATFGAFERPEVLFIAPLPLAYQQLWGLALLALASITTIIIVRWQHHTSSDALALGTLWAGVMIHALPRLRGEAVTFAELQAGGMSLSLADVYVAVALGWMCSRAFAEWRA